MIIASLMLSLSFAPAAYGQPAISGVSWMTPVELVLQKLKDSKKVEDGWRARCPAHNGTSNNSLSVSSGDNERALVFCHSGCSAEAVVKALGLKMSDLQGEKRKRVFASAGAAIAAYEKRLGKHAYRWDYYNAKGVHVGAVLRWDKPDGTKEIRPISRGAEGWSLCGLPKPRPLYRLPQLGTGDRVYITEGEKAADAAHSIGLNSTTSMNGCKAPSKTDWKPLAGRDVVILPDNDDPGRKYAKTVAGILTKLSPPVSIRIVALPDLPPKGDVFEFIVLRRGQGVGDETIRAEIESCCVEATPIDPSQVAEKADRENEDDESGKPRKSAANKLLELLDDISLFHTPGANDANAYPSAEATSTNSAS